jgi:YD repeat-containing protein
MLQLRTIKQKQMKTNLLLSILLFFAISACQKEDLVPADTCKLSTIDRGNGNKHIYTYDASGRIATMTREFDGTGSGNISKYLYTFTYDASGLLAKSTWTLDGVANGSETYTYTNGKVTRANFQYADGSKGMNNIKLDAAGNLLEISYEPDDKSYLDVQYFEYDANNIMIKRGVKDAASGFVYFEYRSKPTGIVKSPEQYLSAKGLPFDVLTGFSWATNIGGEGTTGEVFYPDDKGVLVSDGIDKTLSIKKDAKGYISEVTYENADKSIVKSTFTLTNCN